MDFDSLECGDLFLLTHECATQTDTKLIFQEYRKSKVSDIISGISDTHETFYYLIVANNGFPPLQPVVRTWIKVQFIIKLEPVKVSDLPLYVHYKNKTLWWDRLLEFGDRNYFKVLQET